MPPRQDPISIAFAEGHLLIGNMTIVCQWEIVSEAFIRDLKNPGLVDLLVMERTIPRSKLKGTAAGKRISSAKEKAERRIKAAAAQLSEFEVTEDEIRTLFEARVATRLGSENQHAN